MPHTNVLQTAMTAFSVTKYLRHVYMCFLINRKKITKLFLSTDTRITAPALNKKLNVSVCYAEFSDVIWRTDCLIGHSTALQSSNESDDIL